MSHIDDWTDTRSLQSVSSILAADLKAAAANDDAPTGCLLHRLPRDVVEEKKQAEAARIEAARARFSSRGIEPLPKVRRHNRPSRHPDLAPVLPALAWFYGALDAVPDVGEAANDNSVASVPDRNPKPDKAEEYLKALPAPTRVYVSSVRRGNGRCSEQVSPAQRFNEWTPPRGKLREWGAFRFGTVENMTAFQTVRVKGADQVRTYPVDVGSVTHVWGKRVEQDTARDRAAEDARSVSDTRSSMRWFCEILGAWPPVARETIFPRRALQRNRPL